jgi:hypothetical protein
LCTFPSTAIISYRIFFLSRKKFTSTSHGRRDRREYIKLLSMQPADRARSIVLHTLTLTVDQNKIEL